MLENGKQVQMADLQKGDRVQTGMEMLLQYYCSFEKRCTSIDQTLNVKTTIN